MRLKTRIIILTIILISYSNIFSQEYKVKYGKISENLRAIVDIDKMGFNDDKGFMKLVPFFDFPENYDGTLPFFNEGLCLYFKKQDSVESNGSYNFGFINSNFEVVIPAIFPYWGFYCDGFPTKFVNDRAIASLSSDKYTLINKKGELIGDPFEYSIYFLAACGYYPEISEGLVAASKNTQFGYLNPINGKTAIPFKYSLAGPFSDGIAAVEINQQYLTFIDKTGNVVINKKFYTKKRGVKGVSIYHDGDGDGHPGKYINGKIFIRYFDNDGYGKRVFALVDRKGNVFKKTTSEKYFEDPVFKKYLDVEE